ncbi:MAG: polysaccharide pyruvyl transferase family protein [Firmicutes bacterium]|nr:polysaccharide pyruvyl transferase family protein [Bacillota bacterium]
MMRLKVEKEHTRGKVAIVTIKEECPNYGNSLQNYAVLKVLQKYGFSVETLVFEYDKNWLRKLRLKQLAHKISRYRFSSNKIYWTCSAEKRRKFYRFHKKSCPYRFVKDVNRLQGQYDYFVVGSDQVWNPKWYNVNALKKDMYFLTFAKPEQKICFAPSFGISEIPVEWKDYFREQLLTFPRISVREKSGADLIHDLTGRDAEVIIDPTLVIESEEWRTIMNAPDKVNTECGYILVYFLGGISENRKHYIDGLAEQYNFTVYDILDKNCSTLFTADPGEFLFLIEHARLVLTDSFHACVFSFLLDKPFQVFEREGTELGMFSRIADLLDLFNLQRKIFDSGLENDLFECDYSEGKQVLEVERKKALSFLKESLHLK